MRFPEFTEEWKIHSLTDYLEFKNGMNPDAKRFGKGTKFISVMDILNNRYICYDNIRAFVEANESDFDNFGVHYGDILFQRSSETLEDVGRANVYLDNNPAIFGGFIIRGRKKGNYNPLFFRYLLASPYARKRIIKKGAGAQHFNIGQAGLSKILLNFPSIKEQERIAKLFNIIDERIATQNKIIEDLKKLKSAIYQFVFESEDAESTLLANLAKIVKGKQINGEYLSDLGEYYVMNGGVELSGYYSECNTDANTISISEGGNSCGYVQYNKVPFWSGGHCYTLQNLSQEINEKFLFHYLKFQESKIMKLRIGSGLPNIQKKDLAKFIIILPSIERQKTLATIFDTIDNKESNETTLRKTYEIQKSSLLQQMFI